MENFRNKYGAMTFEAQDIDVDIDKMLEPIFDKYEEILSRDQILYCIVSGAHLISVERTLRKAMKMRKEERGTKWKL